MSRQPSYPKDAPVSPAPSGEAPAGQGGDSNRTKKIVAGAAIGIGSAAIVAALLYSSRNKR